RGAANKKERNPEGPAPEKPFAGLDKMMADQSTFHGRVTGSDDASPRWWPVGGVRASTLRKDVRSEITRVVASNADFANPPALFHTSAGDVLPGNLRLLDRSGVEFESSVIESTRLAAGQVEAIQFGSANASHSQGFDSPLWKVLKGTEKTVEKSPNKVRMKPETSIGHSTALQGGQIGFSIANTGMSTLRLRLFCAGTDSARCPTLILSHWGNRIYYGLETGEGQLNPQQIACTSTEALVRLVIGEKHLELFLNNLPVQKFVIPSDKRAGSGLIFEPAGMWGNSVNAIELSDFSMTSEPGQIWLPDVAAEARMHALTVPRFRKEDLPRHALLAANGDVLRGEIEAVTPTHFGFRSGLEKLRIPRERVKAAIWLKKPLVEGPPREVHPVQKRLEEPFNHHIRYSQADLKTMIGVIKGQMGDLVFKLPEKADSRKFPMQFGGQAVGDLLDEICGLFDLRYRVDSAGVIVIEPLSRLSKDLLPKSYWIKADTLPEPALIQGMVEGKGISFPPGASLHWQPQGMQLSMTNTAANHQKLAALIDTEWGGSLGSPTHWLLLANGARFSLAVERFGSDFITGSHPLYGRCKVPLSQLCQIRTAMPESGAGLKALSHWHLRLAPEPVLPETGGESSAALGKEAKPFKLPLLEGGDFDLAQQKGKIVVLDFWATWCGPCIKSLPGLIEAMAAFPAEQVKLIGVNQSEPADQVKRFLETRKWKLSVAMDAGQGVSRQYGVDGIPHTVVIGPDGKVAWVKTGYSAQAAMETADAVRKLLAPPASN
ncbi:MAG: TlpA disulfide reductase family protein, partial [Verrucomicrobiota bacterium]